MLLLLNRAGASASASTLSKLKQKANLIVQKKAHTSCSHHTCSGRGGNHHHHYPKNFHGQSFHFGNFHFRNHTTIFTQQRNFRTSPPMTMGQPRGKDYHHPYSYRDKYGRRVTRRVIRGGGDTHKSNNKATKLKSKSSSSKKKGRKEARVPLWKQILTQKIITPTNIVPKPIQPPQNIKFTPILEARGSNSNVSSTGGGNSGQNISSNATTGLSSGSSANVGASTGSIAASSSAGSAASTTMTTTSVATASTSASASTITATTPTATSTATSTTAANATNASVVGVTVSIPTRKSRRKLLQWLRDNIGTIILNLGSIATLTAFTRTDILELRLLSITGSLSSVIYFMSRPPPYNIWPILWSLVFASTNAYMVYYIYEERKGRPKQFTRVEYDVYEEHFCPHAVTPRQFEKVLNRARVLRLKRGDVLLQGGQRYNSVYLVISGATEAVTGTMSRRVTAASSRRGHRDELKGGDAGAWVGELAFLEYLNQRDQKKKKKGGGGGASKGFARLAPPPPASAVQPLATTAMDDTATEETSAAPSAISTKGISSRGSDRNKNNHPKSNEGSKIARTAGKGEGAEEHRRHDDDNDNRQESITQKAILTYIATEDSTLYEWDHEELADLLSTSSDLRSSITRAMTAAVVGKVVNLYISKADADTPRWTKWFQDIGGGGGGGGAGSGSGSGSSSVQVNIAQGKE